jgi:hypothetical protein
MHPRTSHPGRRLALSMLVGPLWALSWPAFGAEPVATTGAPVYPIGEVIAQVKREVAAAQRTPGAGVILSLDKLEVTLQVARGVDVNGGASFGVPAAGFSLGVKAGRSSQEVSTVEIELSPPTAGEMLGMVETRSLGLAEMIVQARRELLLGAGQEPRLVPRRVVMTLHFGLTSTGGPQGEWKFLIGSVGAGETVASAQQSTVKLTFSVKRRKP